MFSGFTWVIYREIPFALISRAALPEFCSFKFISENRPTLTGDKILKKEDFVVSYVGDIGKVVGDINYGLGEICSLGPAFVSTRVSAALWIILGFNFTCFGRLLISAYSLYFRVRLIACRVSSVICLKSFALLRIRGTSVAIARTANLS